MISLYTRNLPYTQDTGSLGSSHSSGSRRSSGGSLSRPNVHRQRTPEEQTLVGMLEAVFAVMEEPKGAMKIKLSAVFMLIKHKI